jgi:hypothetical protein
VRLEGDAQRRRRALGLSPVEGLGGIRRVPEDGDARHSGKRFLQHLEPFRAELRQHLGHAGDVPAGLGKAGNVARSDRIAMPREDDRNGHGRFSGCIRLRRSHREDYVHVQAHQLGGKRGQPLKFAVGVAVLDGDVLSVHIPEFPQPLSKRVEPSGVCGSGRSRQHTNAGGLARLLRVDGERRGEDTESKNDESDQPHAAGESSGTPVCAPAPRPRAPGRREVPGRARTYPRTAPPGDVGLRRARPYSRSATAARYLVMAAR